MTKPFFENADILAAMKAMVPYWNDSEDIQNVVSAALFLASPEATWVTGVALPVDGGASV